MCLAQWAMNRPWPAVGSHRGLANSSAMLKFITIAWCSGDLHVRPGAATVAANGSHARLRPNRIQDAVRPLSGHCEAANGSRARLQHNMT